MTLYSADEENRRLLNEDGEVRKEIARAFGAEYFDPQGLPDRIKLSRLVSNDPVARKTLEGIMHTRLERAWLPAAEKNRGVKSSFFVAEIPLLYEKGVEDRFDKVLAIGCSDGIRKSRLSSHRSISNEQADRWLSVQQSQDQKMTLADHLFWNDGHPHLINLQISQLLRYSAIP